MNTLARPPRERLLLNLKSLLLVAISLGGAMSVPALAVDGVIEINQARAAAGNVTPGDNPGFPVSINAAGSYRLTSNLNAAAGFEAIFVEADDVTIDLNGFTVTSAGGAFTDGIGLGNRKNIEVRNGTIRGFSRHGILAAGFSESVRTIGVRAMGNGLSGIEIQGKSSLIDGCLAVGNGMGFRAEDGGLVVNSVARGNTGVGLSGSFTTGYRSCVFTGNNGGDANPQVNNALQLGTNICGADTVCP